MAQSDSNSEDALDDLVNKIKNRRAEGKRASGVVPQTGGLRPSEILFMPEEQKKIIHYLSERHLASIEDIKQVTEFDQAQILKILSSLKDDGFVHETLVDGKTYYRVKFIDTTVKNNGSPQKLSKP